MREHFESDNMLTEGYAMDYEVALWAAIWNIEDMAPQEPQVDPHSSRNPSHSFILGEYMSLKLVLTVIDGAL